mmetsp:Transcript_32994/g.86674  ORF Transcript_32994/g.86674 Transcript_32994/m.86674 type:complete len:258 (+) Transcript_32994:1363-2136(+)
MSRPCRVSMCSEHLRTTKRRPRQRGSPSSRCRGGACKPACVVRTTRAQPRRRGFPRLASTHQLGVHRLLEVLQPRPRRRLLLCPSLVSKPRLQMRLLRLWQLHRCRLLQRRQRGKWRPRRRGSPSSTCRGGAPLSLLLRHRLPCHHPRSLSFCSPSSTRQLQRQLGSPSLTLLQPPSPPPRAWHRARYRPSKARRLPSGRGSPSSTTRKSPPLGVSSLQLRAPRLPTRHPRRPRRPLRPRLPSSTAVGTWHSSSRGC